MIIIINWLANKYLLKMIRRKDYDGLKEDEIERIKQW